MQEVLRATSQAQGVADLYRTQLEAAITTATPASSPEAPTAEVFRCMQGKVRVAARESIRQDPVVEQATANLRASIRQNQDVAYATLYDEGVETSMQRVPDPGRRPGKAPEEQAPPRP